MSIHPQVRVTVRPYGSVVPLVFLAFGIACSYVLSRPPSTQLGGGAGWNHVGGWLALGIFCLAMYTGLAFLLEDAKGVAILPVGRRGSSKEAIEGDLTAQLRGLGDEPGVRKHL